MIYIFCGEIKSFAQEEKEAIRRLFSADASKKYIDTLCGKKNDAQINRSLSCLWGVSRLSRYSGTDIRALRLAKTPEGKPYFEDSEIKFSLSHSDGYFAVALSTDGEVGIDIEEDRLTDEKAERLAKRFFSEDEQKSLGASNTPARDFLTLWTVKEAYTKMIGRRLGEIVGIPTEKFNCDRLSFDYRDARVTLCYDGEARGITRVFS